MTTLQELELDYYIDPADIFPGPSGKGVKSVIDLVILPKLSHEDDAFRIVLTEMTKHSDFLETLEESCKRDVMNSKVLWDFTNTYSICELKDNKRFWRTFIKEVEESVRRYFRKSY